MPGWFPGNAPATCGERSHRTHALRLGLVVFVCIVSGNPAVAQDDDPVFSTPADIPVATDVPPPPPTEPPPPPTAVPPVVEPTSEPTQPPVLPTAAPTSAPPAEPPAVPAQEPTATAAPAVQPTATAEPTLAPVVTDDTLVCQPQGTTIANARTAITHDCSLVAGSARTATRIHAELADGGRDGWRIQIVYRDATGALTETSAGPDAGAMLATALEPGAKVAFQVRILPPDSIPAESSATVILTTGVATAGNPDPALDGPQTSLGAQMMPHPPHALTCVAADGAEITPGSTVDTACAAPGAAAIGSSMTPPPCAPTVSASGNTLDFGASRWNGTAWTTVPGTLTLTIDATGATCTGLDGDWDIQVSALAMTRVGGTETIAPASLAFAGSAASGAPPTGISPVPGPVTLDGTDTIATTTGSDTAGGAWSVAFSLSPPADTPPGTYAGTITIDVVASSSD